MHDGMPYGRIQGQGQGHYSTIKDRKSPIKGSRPSVPHGTNFFRIVVYIGHGGDDSAQPSRNQSSPESVPEADRRPRSRHRRVLRLDGRSSSETSGGSTGDAAPGGGLGPPGSGLAERRGSSVDEVVLRAAAGHNRHVSFILSSGEVDGAAGDSITSSVVGRRSFDAVGAPGSNRFPFSPLFLLQ